MHVQKFRGLTFALAPGWTHPPQTSACRAGQCPGALSPPCSSWVATEAAMALTKHCNPPSRLGLSETGTAQVHTKYFTVYCEVGKISLQSVMSCLHWKQLPGTLNGLLAVFLIYLCTSIIHQHPKPMLLQQRTPVPLHSFCQTAWQHKSELFPTIKKMPSIQALHQVLGCVGSSLVQLLPSSSQGIAKNSIFISCLLLGLWNSIVVLQAVSL